MNQKKIGSIFIITTLALASIGISYAGFTDEIHIFGTVNTGTVDLEIIDWYSGTWVFKTWNINDMWTIPNFQYTTLDVYNEILIFSGWSNNAPTEDQVKAWANLNGGNAELVSFSEAKPGTTHEDVTYDVDFEYDNLFPCIDFTADFILHYIGSIPAKIDVAEIFSENGWLQELWAMYKADSNAGFGAYVEAYRCQPLISNEEIIDWAIDYNDPVDIGYQLHYCNYVYVKLVIHLPQDNNYQGLSGIFTGKVGVIQWNDQCEEPQPQTGTIIIEKITDPSGGTGFGFTNDIPSGPASFILDHDGSQTFTNIPSGTYTVTEDNPNNLDYYLTDLICMDSDGLGTPSTVNLGSLTATINLDPGETVTCTFYNQQVTYADGEILSKTPILTVTDQLPDAGTDFFDSTASLTLTVDTESETIILEGPTTVSRSDPAIGTRVVETEIVAMQLSGWSDLLGQVLGLQDEVGNPAAAPILINENPDALSLGQIIPVDPIGLGDFPAESFFDVNFLIQTPLGVIPGLMRLEAEIYQIPPLNTQYIGMIDMAIVNPETGELIGRISGQIGYRPIKPAIPVNTDVEFLVETKVHNAGPFGPVDFNLTATADAPPGCTITPSAEIMLIEDLAVGEVRTVFEFFTVHCVELSQHHFPITNEITTVDLNVQDSDLSDNMLVTELRVAVVGNADGEIVSSEALNLPTEVEMGVEVEFFVQTVVTNAGSFGPADFDLTTMAIDLTGCTITPPGQIVTVEDLAVGEHRTVMDTFTIECSQPGVHTFHLINKISPDDVHLVDTDITNNYNVIELTVGTQDLDYGDAPDDYGTLLASNGARHAIIQGLSLGPTVDAEQDGQLSLYADGDDIVGSDDEDGIILPITLNIGQNTLAVDGGPSGGMLDAWIDYNQNGVFDHPTEHLFGGYSPPLAPGLNYLTYDVPAGIYLAPYARFRLSSSGGLLPTGFAPDGEVEDYLLVIPI